jgi:hypothetical protein
MQQRSYTAVSADRFDVLEENRHAFVYCDFSRSIQRTTWFSESGVDHLVGVCRLLQAGRSVHMPSKVFARVVYLKMVQQSITGNP